MRLIIKARSAVEAIGAARMAGIRVDLATVRQVNEREVVVDAPDSYDEQAMVWFVSDCHDGPPFPFGSLLWYGLTDGRTSEEQR